MITGLSTGGAEMMLYKLLSHMKSECLESEVVSLMDRGTLGDRIEGMGVPLHTLQMSAGTPSIRSLLSLARLVKRIEPDLIHCWMYHANLAGLLARNLSGVESSLVWGIRQSLYDTTKEKLLTRMVIRLGAALSNWPSAILYNSRTSATQHRKYGYQAESWDVIPNGFDCNTFKPSATAERRLRSELGLQDEVVVGNVARYHPMKDHNGFLRAAKVASSVEFPVSFVMAGRGVDEKNDRLVRLRETLGLRGRVHFLGERDDIPDLMNVFDIYVSSSAWGEAFPNTLGEAMASEVPCVTTEVGDSADVVGLTGHTVPPGDPLALGRAVRKLIKSGEEHLAELGGKARDRIIDNYSLGAITEEYRSYYRELISHKQHRVGR